MRSGNTGKDMTALGSDTTAPSGHPLADTSSPAGTFRVNPATAGSAQVASRLAEARDQDKEKEVRAADKKIESRSSVVKSDALNSQILKDVAKETNHLEELEKAASSPDGKPMDREDVEAKIADAREKLTKLPDTEQGRAEKKKLEALINESEKLLKDPKSTDDLAAVIMAVLNSRLKAAAALTNTPSLGAGLRGSQGSSKEAPPEAASAGGGGFSTGGDSSVSGGGGGAASTAGANGVGPGPAGGSFEKLTEEQKQNAQIIIQVGRDKGMPERAIHVALITAMQESTLRNLNYGDRDSLGLFQQRPSQGWGTPAQVTDPKYAATIFYDRLQKVQNYENLPPTVAAQSVQRSAFPDAYAKWEGLAAKLLEAYPKGGTQGAPQRDPGLLA
ncbi:MAG: hypothetical protein ACT4TC_24650 [Myxococcaceae bacterium]